MIPIEVFRSILERPDPALLEKMTKEANRLTRQFFGRQFALYTPLYLDNHCDGGCTYCGFNRNRDIERIKLTSEQIATEMEIIAGWGIDHILLLRANLRNPPQYRTCSRRSSLPTAFFPRSRWRSIPWRRMATGNWCVPEPTGWRSTKRHTIGLGIAICIPAARRPISITATGRRSAWRTPACAV